MYYKTIIDEIEDNQRTERHDRNYSVEFINLLVDKNRTLL
jgi:DNA-dependent RNA polymerase auxiliary subunit epsilon